MAVTLTCVRCGKTFTAPPCEAWRKTCSPACRKTSITRPCAICGTEYQVKPSHAHMLCCSLECGHELRRRNFAAKAEQALGEPLKEGITRRLADGWDMRDIAKACGFTDTRAVHRLMQQLDIPMRPASESVRMQWRNNAERRAAIGQLFSDWSRNHPIEAMQHSIAANLALQTTSPTSIERRLMDALDAAGIPYTFQYVVGNKFLCDFAFPDAMLIVECDGTYWHSTPKQRRRDASKDAYLQACGYTVLRFSDKQLEQNVAGCVSAIRALLR